jgi:hypothetical protein
MIFILLFPVLFFYGQVMADDLYQYTDKTGNLVISNKNPASDTKPNLATNETARRKILKDELHHEIEALKQSQQLQEQSTSHAKMDFSQDIAAHQKNINVLTKQLNQEG